MLALVAASYFSDITLTVAMTPSDFVWQGFMQGNKDGCKEWPIEGESTLSWHGKPLGYMPFVYKHPDYWKVIEQETKEQAICCVQENFLMIPKKRIISPKKK